MEKYIIRTQDSLYELVRKESDANGEIWTLTKLANISEYLMIQVGQSFDGNKPVLNFSSGCFELREEDDEIDRLVLCTSKVLSIEKIS